MKNIVGYYRYMMQKSLPLKLTIITIFITFPLSIVFTIVCLSLDCTYSTLYQPCSYLTQNNPNECLADSLHFCCGQEGNLTCLNYTSCIIKP